MDSANISLITKTQAPGRVKNGGQNISVGFCLYKRYNIDQFNRKTGLLLFVIFFVWIFLKAGQTNKQTNKEKQKETTENL